jgi:hypothetical protein
MVFILCAAPSVVQSQTLPKVFFACYVQNTGTLYRIREPGLPTQCTNVKHTEFSWIDGVPGYDHGALNGLADDDHPQYLLADGTRPLAGNLRLGGFTITGLAAATAAGEAVRFEQAVKTGDAAGGDLAGTYPTPTVARLQGQPVASTAPASGQLLMWNGSLWTPTTPAAPATGTPLNTPNTLVQRDAAGGFAAGLLQISHLTVSTAARIGPNTAAGSNGSVAMGANTTAGAAASTAMGENTTASGEASVAMNNATHATGFGSTAMGSGSEASGFASLATGQSTTASGDRTTAMGNFASTNGLAGSFVYGDGSTIGTGFQRVVPTAANQFVVRAAGGLRLFTTSTTDGFVFEGGSGQGCTLDANEGGVLPKTKGGNLTCSGMIQSTAGGFWFPDGSVQTTAATGGGISDHGSLTGLTDDDHPQYLLAEGVRSSTDGFAVTGTVGSGAIPITGPGTRVMWYPGKAAFRAGFAGTVGENYWDDFLIGLGSAAFGYRTIASGQASTALGSSTKASGDYSIAMGVGTQATGGVGTALGVRTVASGARAFAAGIETVASGSEATALGNQTTASGSSSTALGLRTTASGQSSTAIGALTTASGDFSIAIGHQAGTNSQSGAFVFGDVSAPAGNIVEATVPNSFVVRAQHVWFGKSGDQPANAAGYLTADGIIASTSGGFKFPDGTVQTTAGGGGVSDHGALNGLADDDHPQYLLGDGVRASTNGFAVTGTLATGVIPATGPGVRLMWYPAKAAFRAGQVSTQWDDDNIGFHSTATGRRNTASGDFSVAMGDENIASGDRSVALGTRASTNLMSGSFVYGDGSSAAGDNIDATVPNSFVVRAQHVWFGRSGDQVATAVRYIETSTGAYLSNGGDWTNASDVNRKENFRDVDGARVLDALSRLAIRNWNYRAEDDSVRHLGPTAQDFYAAFHLGDSDKAIGTVDEAGVALLAIQALERRSRDQAREIEALRAELAALRAMLDSLLAKQTRGAP